MAYNKSQFSYKQLGYGSTGEDEKEAENVYKDYLIKRGDTLDMIARTNGVTTAQLVQANGIKNPNLIYAGSTIKIPTGGQGSGSSSTGSAPTPTEQKSYSDIDLSKYDSGYQKSDDVINAESKKTDAENAVNNYGDFSYSNQGQFDEIMNKILNREDFSYDLNGDALYQQYKDKYVQQGKMAMQDTMGQAAAMTGGYGNSYASTVGNQAYQASLENLNDIVPELYQMAYDRYNQEGQDLYNQYGMMSDDYNREYGEWGDKRNLLVSDRDYYGDEAYNAYAKDYGTWSDQRAFDTDQYWNETNMGYTMEENAKQYARQDAYAMLGAGIMPTDEVLNAAGISKTDAKQIADAYKSGLISSSGSGGSGGSGGGGNNSYNNGGGGDGEFHKATFARTDDKGNNVFYINGKEYTYAQGINPYTGTKNSDIKNGAFSNGYQPNNINGQKLSKSGITDVVNGVTQNVWKTPDGKLWIWDGTQNKYLQYEE